MSLFRSLLLEAGGDTPVVPYTPVEYIESDGRQSIATGVTVGDNTLRVQCKLRHTGSQYGNDGFFLSGYYGSYGIGDMYGDGENQHWSFYTANSGQMINIAYEPYTDYVMDYTFTSSTYSATINGETDSGNKQNVFYPSNSELYAFSRGADWQYPFFGRIYYMKIYIDGDLVRDFIPVLDSNNVACLYDRVTSQFYYDRNSAGFTYA